MMASAQPVAPHDDGSLPLSRPFLVVSLLGIAWGLAHVAMEALFDHHKLSPGLILAGAWIVVLWYARHRSPHDPGGDPRAASRVSPCPRRRAVPASIVLGNLACFWVALMHLGSEVPAALPSWLLNPHDAAPSFVAYSILVYAGILIGLVYAWVSATALAAWPWRPWGVSATRATLATATLVLLVAGLGAVAREGTASPERWVYVVAMALAPAAIAGVRHALY